MDFDYDPCGGLGDFCIDNIDKKLQEEAKKLLPLDDLSDYSDINNSTIDKKKKISKHEKKQKKTEKSKEDKKDKKRRDSFVASTDEDSPSSSNESNNLEYSSGEKNKAPTSKIKKKARKKRKSSDGSEDLLISENNAGTSKSKGKKSKKEKNKKDSFVASDESESENSDYQPRTRSSVKKSQKSVGAAGSRKGKSKNIPNTNGTKSDSENSSSEVDSNLEDSINEETRNGKKRRCALKVSKKTNADIVDLTSFQDLQNLPTSSTSQKGRARRSYMSQLAQEMSIQEIVDLSSDIPLAINSQKQNQQKSTPRRGRPGKKRGNGNRRRPRPRDPNVLTIGSDTEDEIFLPIKIVNHNNKLNKSIENNDNPEISVNIQWHQEIEKIPMRKYQKFVDIMDIFAKREKVNTSDILFNLNSHILSQEDTLESINYKFADIITGRVVEKCQISLFSNTPKLEKDEISLKIQSNLWKKSIEINIKKSDTLNILYIKCEEALKVKRGDFILIFDGDILPTNQTPEDLDMEGDEIIDCVLKKV